MPWRARQDGRRDTIGMLRHKDPILCGVGAEARMIIHRFDIKASVTPHAEGATLAPKP